MVIEKDPPNLCLSGRNVSDYLKKKFNKRVIPESEIAQAIAYSSTTKYCNTMNSKRCITMPEYKEPELGDILEEETPDVATVIFKFTFKLNYSHFLNVLVLLLKFPIREPCVIPCSSTYSQDDFSLEGQEHLRAKRYGVCYSLFIFQAERISTSVTQKLQYSSMVRPKNHFCCLTDETDCQNTKTVLQYQYSYILETAHLIRVAPLPNFVRVK